MRQQRDLRFSRDRTPYKERTAGFLQARPGGSLVCGAVGAGVLRGARLQGADAAISSSATARRWPTRQAGAALARPRGGGGGGWARGLGRGLLKTAPRGFPRDHPRVALLRHKLMIFGARLGAGARSRRDAALEHRRRGRGGRASRSRRGSTRTSGASDAARRPGRRCAARPRSGPSATMRTCVRVRRRRDPPRRPRRVLRVGRAARRPAAARQAGRRRRRGGARRELRGEGARRQDRDGRAGSGGGCARTRSSSRRACRPTPRRARRCSRSSATRRRWSRACRSTRRSSTSAGCGGSPGRRRRSPSGSARAVLDEVGLPITVGVARTKFLAKVASGVAKPDGLLVVPPDGELEFLHPLPVERLWGVGPKTAAKLHARGIHTVGEVAQLAEATLVKLLGRASGRQLHALSHNRDPRRVDTRRRRRSIGSQRALGRGARTPAELEVMLVGLVDKLARRLRGARRVCRTVTLRLRFDDFERATRSHTLPEATARTEAILVVARELLAAALPLIRRRGITLIGLTLGSLTDDRAVQLALPVEPRRGRPRPKRAPPPGPDPPLRRRAAPRAPRRRVRRAGPAAAQRARPRAGAAGATRTPGSRRGSTPAPRSRGARRTTPTSTRRPRRRSTRRWTNCAIASARRRSRARCCSGATRASRCRSCRTDADVAGRHLQSDREARLRASTGRAGGRGSDINADSPASVGHAVGVVVVERPQRRPCGFARGSVGVVAPLAAVGRADTLGRWRPER